MLFNSRWYCGVCWGGNTGPTTVVIDLDSHQAVAVINEVGERSSVTQSGDVLIAHDWSDMKGRMSNYRIDWENNTYWERPPDMLADDHLAAIHAVYGGLPVPDALLKPVLIESHPPDIYGAAPAPAPTTPQQALVTDLVKQQTTTVQPSTAIYTTPKLPQNVLPSLTPPPPGGKVGGTSTPPNLSIIPDLSKPSPFGISWAWVGVLISMFWIVPKLKKL